MSHWEKLIWHYPMYLKVIYYLNALRPRQDDCNFANNNLKWILLMKIYEFLLIFRWSLILRVQLTIFQHFGQVVAWHWPGNKPLSKCVLFSLLTHIRVTLAQWVNAKYSSCLYAFNVLSSISEWWDNSIFSPIFIVIHFLFTQSDRIKIIYLDFLD